MTKVEVFCDIPEGSGIVKFVGTFRAMWKNKGLLRQPINPVLTDINIAVASHDVCNNDDCKIGVCAATPLEIRYDSKNVDIYQGGQCLVSFLRETLGYVEYEAVASSDEWDSIWEDIRAYDGKHEKDAPADFYS